MNGRAQRGRVRSTLTDSPEGFLHEPGGSAPGGHRAYTIPNLPDPFVLALLFHINRVVKNTDPHA